MLKRAQLAGANYSYTKHPLSYFIHSMQENDIHAIEMYAASPHLYPYDYGRSAVRKIKHELDTAGIRVICLTAEQCMIPVSLSIDDEIVRNRSLDYYYRTAEQASEMGSPIMHMVAGGVYIESNQNENFSRAVEGIFKVSERAKLLGVKIALEADRTSPVKNTNDIRKVIDMIGRDRVVGLLDTNAVYHAGEDFEKAVCILGNDLAHMHFIDLGPQGGCLVPGEGALPLPEYLKILDKYHYEGFMTPELWGSRYLDEAEEAFVRSKQYCYQYLE